MSKYRSYSTRQLFEALRNGRADVAVRAGTEIERRLNVASGYPTPVSTVDELPPEHTDILWWYPRGEYQTWNMGMYNEDKEFPPGCLRAQGNRWYLCNGPTWWMYPPPDPTEEV